MLSLPGFFYVGSTLLRCEAGLFDFATSHAASCHSLRPHAG
jgi:hypothetical protein